MWWSWVLAVIGCVGIHFAGKGNKWGWALGVGAQVLWMGYAVTTKQYGFCLTAVVYGFFQSKAFLNQHNADRKKAMEVSA